MTITDPQGTNGTTPYYGPETRPFLNHSASVAIPINSLVALVWDEATQTIRVALADTDVHDPAVKVGVAAEEIAAGLNNGGLVITRGFALVNIGSGSVAVSERLILTANAGEADGVAADATTVEGDTHGVFLGDELGTTNTAPVWIG